MLKVAVIGGGSTYTPELVAGFVERAEHYPLGELWLADTDSDRLAVVGGFARRMAAARGARFSVHLTTDRRDAIRDADHVLTQIRVGRMAARQADEHLGHRHGLIGQETTGVGGMANALRTIPVVLDIARDVEEVAHPGALLVNFTNPAGLVTEALCRHGMVDAIGLCNVPWTVKAEVAAALRCTPTQVEFDYVGLNHLSWIRGVTVDGVDRTAEVLSGLRGLVGKQAAADDEPVWSPESISMLAAIPNYYLLYYYETDACIRHQAATPTRASVVAEVEEKLLAQYADPLLDHKPAELVLRGGAYYSEAAAALMADLVGGAGAVHVVNTTNRGAIPGLADDVVVEVAARVVAGGVEPLPVAPLRADVDALLRTVKDFELLTVEAAVHGDHDAALRALVTNPLGPNMSRAPAVWARLREVHAGWLGKLG